MLDDFAMEKKASVRSVQAPVKGNSTESKKNQDLVVNKVFTRPVRRREPSVTTPPKYDVCRRTTPQRIKYPDKRPRAKGQLQCGKEDTKVAESEPVEYGSVLVPGKKKQNLNHLLNFHYAPRECAALGQGNGRRNQPGWGRRAITTHKHKYNKEQFLQANCQFVVRQEYDYTEYLTNPDMLVGWDLIEQIHFCSGENLSCPICLYPPVAAKITRCGHVFCWSCILHYLALSDKDCRKCPICFEAVNKNDLKSVIPVMHSQYSVGEEITFRLMRRERGSLIAVPMDESGHHIPNQFLSMSEKHLNISYSKLLLASATEVMSIITRERLELEAQLLSEADCPEKCFTEEAVELLKQRELALFKANPLHHPIPSCRFSNEDIFEDHSSVDLLHAETSQVKVYQSSWDEKYETLDSCATNPASLPVSMTNSLNVNAKQNEFLHCGSMGSESLDTEADDGISTISVDDLETPETIQSMSTGISSPHKNFFFYQASDGQHIYLHALNVRMLERQYGSLEYCPRTLKGYIVEKEMGSMTEELRNKLRCLQHLPVTCQFEVAEIQLKPPVISKHTIEYFQDQLDGRKRRRQRRARDERRREKRINDEERRQMGRYPSPSICLESHMQFPSCGTELDVIGNSVPSPPSVSSISNSPSGDSAFAGAMGLLTSTAAKITLSEEQKALPSFAQMLREGKSKMSFPRDQGKSAGGQENSETDKICRTSESDLELEGYVPVPDYKQSLNEAISKAMENAAALKETAQGDAVSGKKKKKQKKKVLFATSMNFNNK